MQRTMRASKSTPPFSRPTASLTRSPAPYRSSTSARSRRSRGPVAVRRLDQPFGLARRERARQAARAAGQVELGRGVVGSLAEQDEVAEERADRGRAAGDRRAGEALRAHVGQVALELLGRDRVRRAIEPRGERGEVTAVGLDGARRAPCGEERQEALDLRVRVHEALFAVGDVLPAIAEGARGRASLATRPGTTRSSALATCARADRLVRRFCTFGTRPSQTRHGIADSVRSGAGANAPGLLISRSN